MVRSHPACLRESAPALRLVSGRNDGIRNLFFLTGIAPATSTGFGTHFRSFAQRCAGCRLQGGARLRAKPTAVDDVTTRQRELRRACGRTASTLPRAASLARLMQYGLRARSRDRGWDQRRRRQRHHDPSAFAASFSRRAGSAALHRAKQGCRPPRVPGAVICKADSRHFCCHADRG